MSITAPTEVRSLGLSPRALVAALWMALAGLCPASATTGTAADEASPRTHTITIEGMRFEERTLTVRRGDRVTWVNKDLVPHNVTSDAGGPLDSKTIDPNESWTYTASRPGEYPYTCTFHPNMKATLIVK